jgi:methylthioribose-1-phosphate isomerase
MKVRHHSIVQLARSEYVPLIQDAKQSYEALSTEKDIMLAQHKTLMEAIDEKIERKLSSALEECQIISAQGTRSLTLLREEYDISKKKYDEIYKDFEEQNETLSTLRDTERNLVRAMDELKDETNRTFSCTEKQIKDNREKERCIEELKLKILEQER